MRLPAHSVSTNRSIGQRVVRVVHRRPVEDSRVARVVMPVIVARKEIAPVGIGAAGEGGVVRVA